MGIKKILADSFIINSYDSLSKSVKSEIACSTHLVKVSTSKIKSSKRKKKCLIDCDRLHVTSFFLKVVLLIEK